MPRGSDPIIPRGSAFRICLWQIHGSRRRAGARVRGRFLGDCLGIFLKKRRRKASRGTHRVWVLCLRALPLLYPAAPPSVFAVGKYTAPAVALVREYVVVFWGIVWGFF